MFCPDIGTASKLFGKVSFSQSFSKIVVKIVSCNQDSSTIPCASEQEMEDFWILAQGSLNFKVFYLNSILSPEYFDYKKVYF